MLRAIRFSVSLGFNIDKDTGEAIKRHCAEISQISPERIRAELVKMLSSKDPRRAVELLDEFGLLEHILPEVVALKGVSQPKIYHPEGDAYVHTLFVVENLSGKPYLTVVAGLLHDIGKSRTGKINPKTGREQFLGHDSVGADMTKDVMRRLKFTNKEISEVCFAVDNHMKMHSFPKMKLSKRRMLYAEPYFNTLLDLSLADSKSSGHIKEAEELQASVQSLNKYEKKERVFLSGKDLIDLGLDPSPEFGIILAKVKEMQLDGDIKSKEEALEYVRNNYV